MIKHYAFTLVGLAVLIGVISISLVRADTSATIDFEGLDAGTIVNEVGCGSGITCSNGDLSGPVLVRAHNPVINNGNTNTAMIFNADCVALVNCTGGDDDLSYPGHGKTLINSADLNQSDPDDQENVGSFMEFDFSGLGPGGVTINSIDVGDIEEREIGAFVAGSASSCTGTETRSNTIPLPITGNNVIETVNFELSGVHCFLVHLNGSGTVDNIRFTMIDLSEPGIDIEKSTNGEDADDPTGPVVPVGSTVEFTYEVINTGSVDLINVTVRDNQVSVPATGSAAATIDFEGLDGGTIVTELSCGSGITCSSGDLGGSVLVRAHNPVIDSGNTNTAMIFNAECVAFVDCTGGDDDLSYPGHGKTLINSADLDQSDPDDQENVGSFMEFDFSGFGPEGVTVHSIDVGDIEEKEIGAFAEGSDGPCTGTEIGLNVNPLPITGNNGIETVNFELSGVHCFLVHLNGSGTVDNIQFTTATQTAPDEVAVTCPQDTLAVGESMTCTGSTTATPGQYTNLGTACGDGGGQNVCDEDPSNHFGDIPDGEPESNPAIDVEKWTRIDVGPAGGDLCDTFDKPKTLTMLYTGNNILDHTQKEGKVNVSGDPQGAPVVHIISAQKADGTGKTFFDETVNLEEQFVIGGTERLKSQTFVLIKDQNGELLQTIEFHTSCSQPLELGNQFGAIQLISFADRHGESGTFDDNTDSGVDADSPAGPEGQVGDNITWTYFVTNTGDTPLAEVILVDENGTPGDASDDFSPTFVNGDDNADNQLDLDETWLYQATGSVKLGQYANVGQVSGVGPDDTTVTDQDPSHYLGVFPSGDICEGKGKPETLTMLYTGNNILDHTQKEGKVNISGDPQGAPMVHIISAQKADGTGKIHFEGTVNLGEQFVVGGTERLKSQTFVLIKDQNGELLQSIEFHTSCSQPLERGDQFGSIQLIDSTSR